MSTSELDTRTTLFGRLRAADNATAWREFQSRYGGMLLRFCRSLGLQHADAEDAVQAVLSKLVAGLSTFQYDRNRGRFRDYLFRCARTAIFDLKSGQKRAANPVVHHNGDVHHAHDHALEAAFEREWVNHHYRLALMHVRASMDPRSIAVFEEALMNRPARQIAESMGMTENAVYKALQRVRDRLREQITRQVHEEDGPE
ncbi:MAG TPA: sigma-70 family RNA polymerase sigma factor [Phycisphaerales bacterium]|nr:sigma-70 family RNA polymerase sigma factor [Phycisphaerales bacterium]HRQ75382.1 sigma-70 family RNA polymerase sigma factor [Phycisphaerales bacterium]